MQGVELEEESRIIRKDNKLVDVLVTSILVTDCRKVRSNRKIKANLV